MIRPVAALTIAFTPPPSHDRWWSLALCPPSARPAGPDSAQPVKCHARAGDSSYGPTYPAFRTCRSMRASTPITGGRLINGKAGTAAAGRFGVRVAHREVAAHQLVRVVELRARQEIQAGRVHQHLRPGELDHEVVRLRR